MHLKSQTRAVTLAQANRYWWKPLKMTFLILLGLTSLLILSIVMLIK
ncbi:MAG: hypothetical protein AAFQ83_10665 [Bacteroidota bacterium]